jgi:hypothetical protein
MRVRSPAADHFAHDMRAGFESLEDPIKPHEQSVVWGN